MAIIWKYLRIWLICIVMVETKIWSMHTARLQGGLSNWELGEDGEWGFHILISCKWHSLCILTQCHEGIFLIWSLKGVDCSASCSEHYRKADAEIQICTYMQNLIKSAEDIKVLSSLRLISRYHPDTLGVCVVNFWLGNLILQSYIYFNWFEKK